VGAGHERFRPITEELADLHDTKAEGYGSNDDPTGNLKACEALGIPAHVGVAVRLQDKMARLANVLRDPVIATADETVIDTFNDIAVYAILGRILYEEALKAAQYEHVDAVIGGRHLKNCIYGKQPHPGVRCDEPRVASGTTGML